VSEVTNPTRRKKPSKLRILLAPIFAPIFLVGWIFTFLGESRDNKKQRAVNKTPQKQEEITLSVISEEEIRVSM
jgi:hypothetical protein